VYGDLGNELWIRLYDGVEERADEARAIALDQSGNVLVTGVTWGGETNTDYATVKYDSSGSQLWVRTYNGPSDSADAAWDIAVDNSGCVYVTGESRDASTGWDYVTIKYYPDGLPVWTRRFDGGGDEQAKAVAVDNSGNAYVTGTGGTVKYDARGNFQWVRGGTRSAIAVDESGNVCVTGSAGTTKYDLDGNELWNGNWGGVDIATDASFNVYVCAGGPTYVTVKYSPDGDTAWLREYIGPVYNRPYAIAVDDSGNGICITGASYNGIARNDYLTVKYDQNGNLLWFHRYNGPGWRDDEAYGVALDVAGNVHVTGKSRSVFADDFTTIKYVQFDVLRGDTNMDGVIEPGDVVYLINYLFRDGTPPYPHQAGDCNCDGVVSPGDVVYLINYLFRGWPPPSC
jgi:hypothetical protein